MNAPTDISFDDLDDTSLVPTGKTYRELSRADTAPDFSLGAGKSKATVARYPCSKCRGSGRFIGYTGLDLGRCHRCRGTGRQKTDPEAARRRRDAKARREAAERTAQVEAWKKAHPAEFAWITATAGRFEFAGAMALALARYGCLTEAQMSAVHRCMARDAERTKEREERKPDAEVSGAGFERMLKAFETAMASGLRRPKFRVGDYVFSPAGAASANAGCIYVKREGTYLGRITAAGAFFGSRDASDRDKAEIARISAYPLSAAVMHGKATGRCSCCGRELENEESVALGIGPICRQKWGL